MEIDFIVKYLTHLEFSRHTTISDVHELARDVLKAWWPSKRYQAISISHPPKIPNWSNSASKKITLVTSYCFSTFETEDQ